MPRRSSTLSPITLYTRPHRKPSQRTTPRQSDSSYGYTLPRAGQPNPKEKKRQQKVFDMARPAAALFRGTSIRDSEVLSRHPPRDGHTTIRNITRMNALQDSSLTCTLAVGCHLICKGRPWRRIDRGETRNARRTSGFLPTHLLMDVILQLRDLGVKWR